MKKCDCSSFSLIVAFFVLLTFLTVLPPFSSAISFESKSFRIKEEIIIDHNQVVADLVNFPLLFSTKISNPSFCQPNGYDIVFYDKSGEFQLAHEIELFNLSSGELIVWICIPFLSSSQDTSFQIFYGDSLAMNSQAPSIVWAGYDGVYHLSQLSDSLGEHHLSRTGSVLPDDNGLIAAAQSFDGFGNDYLMTPTNFGVYKSFSVECWVKLNPEDPIQTFLTLPHSNTGVAERLMLVDSEEIAMARNYQTSDYGVNTRGSSPINDGAWHYLVHTYDGESNNLYVDGILEGSDPYSGIVRCEADEFYIGREGDYGVLAWQETVMSGLIDEVSVTTQVLSASRIKTEFNNQNNPSSFFLVGSPVPTISPGFLPLVLISSLFCVLILSKKRNI